MNLNEWQSLRYEDVLLVPQYSDLRSRSAANPGVSLSAQVALTTPILSANMDTVTGLNMALAMGVQGGAGVLHRYTDPDKIVSWIKALKLSKHPAIASIGCKAEDTEKARAYLQAGADIICIDIAHGHSVLMREAIARLKDLANELGNEAAIMAGNVTTVQAALDLYKWGASIVKVGIGNGRACHTQMVTGHGCTNFGGLYGITRSYEWLRTPYHELPRLVADGGIKTSGDIVKALAIGADCVMVGSLLAGTDEAPQVVDAQNRPVYRGMASQEAQVAHHGSVNNGAPEGVSMVVQPKGPVGPIIQALTGGIRSGMSYSGARTIRQLQNRAQFQIVTR